MPGNHLWKGRRREADTGPDAGNVMEGPGRRAALAGGAAVGGVLAARQVGRGAGSKSVKPGKDAFYDTNYTAGKRIYKQRIGESLTSRKGRAALGAGLIGGAAASLAAPAAGIAYMGKKAKQRKQQEALQEAPMSLVKKLGIGGGIAAGTAGAYYAKHRADKKMVRDVRQRRQKGQGVWGQAREGLAEAGLGRKLAIGGAVGAGVGAVGADQFRRGYKKGKVEKRRSATAKGFQDAHDARNRRESDIAEGVGMFGAKMLGKGLFGGKKRRIATAGAATGAGIAGVGYGAKKLGESEHLNEPAQGRAARHLWKSRPFQAKEGVVGSTLKWGGRSLAAADIGLLGASGVKAMRDKKKQSQTRKEGFIEDILAERSTTAVRKGAKVGGRVASKAWDRTDPFVIGTLGVHNAQRKARDVADDRKLNRSQRNYV